MCKDNAKKYLISLYSFQSNAPFYVKDPEITWWLQVIYFIGNLILKKSLNNFVLN